MPITCYRVEPGTYVGEWIGAITMDEVFRSTREVVAMVREDNLPNHVIIVEGSRITRLPLEVRAMIRNNPPDRLAVLVVKAPTIGVILGRMVMNLGKLPVEFYDTMEAAVARSRVILHEHGVI